MENRLGNAGPQTGAFVSKFRAMALSVAAFLLSSMAVGCAAPGEPYERKPPTPVAITDLTALQSGSDVLITFTLPEQGVDNRPLAELPTIEIYRDFFTAPAAGEPAPRAAARPTLLVTIPAAREERPSMCHWCAVLLSAFSHSANAAEFGGVAQLVERRLCKP